MRFVRAFFTNESSSFTYLNVTQFLGALNDHVFKFLIVYFCIDLQGVENSTKILSTTGACFVIPFLFLSATSGTLADRFSKRNIIVATKIMEVIVMGLGVVAFTLHSITGAYFVLFLMAAQSALFGPSKYGIVPEIVDSEKIPKANGLLTCLTFVAIIVGTFLASFITELTGRNFLFASLFCTAISVVGMFTSFCIEYTPPSGSRKKINPWFLGEIYKTVHQIKHQPSLVIAMLGSAYFLFASSFVQLNIVPYAMQSLHLTDAQGGYLFLLVAIGIGIGSMLAAKLSGSAVELGFVPIAGVGMTLACLLLDFWSANLYLTLPTFVFMGLVGGIFLVPLDTYAQVASPSNMRGQVVATTNFFGFCGVLCSAGALYVICDVLGFPADKGFTILGFSTLAMTIAISCLYYDYLSRYLAMLAAKCHFKISIEGEGLVSPSIPSLFICNHTAWNDTLLMLGSQRTRITFLTEQGADHIKPKQIYKLFKYVDVPSLGLLVEQPEQRQMILDTLHRGISLCVLTNLQSNMDEIGQLKQSCQELLEGTPYSTVIVSIQKGIKPARRHILARLTEKFRVPASISFSAV